MKLSKVASVVTALLATDAKPTEADIIAAVLAADKKGKDEGGLGPVEIENKAKDEKEKDEKEFGAKDAEAEYYGHTKDEWEDMSAKDRKAARDKAHDADDPEDTNGKGTDEEIDGMDDVQPKESATNGKKDANGGAMPAKDTAAVVKAALDARDALHAARRDVEPVLGVVTYDSAAQVYKAALDKLGIDTTGVHTSAYGALYKLARDKADAQAPALASDAATVRTMSSTIKGYDRLK